MIKGGFINFGTNERKNMCIDDETFKKNILSYECNNEICNITFKLKKIDEENNNFIEKIKNTL